MQMNWILMNGGVEQVSDRFHTKWGMNRKIAALKDHPRFREIKKLSRVDLFKGEQSLKIII